MRSFDTVEEQRKSLEGVAQNIEKFWRGVAERGDGGDFAVPAASDAAALRAIAAKLGA
jgi:hypothetical protein